MDNLLELPPFPPIALDLGYWWADIKLELWSGYRESPNRHNPTHMAKASGGRVILAIESPDYDCAAPSKEQVAAYAYLVNNEESLHSSIIRAILDDYPSKREAYGLDEEDCMPAVINSAQLKMLIELKEIILMNISKDGIAYVQFDFHAAWDFEHGFNVVTHKDRIVKVGYSGSGNYIAKEDSNSDE